MWVSNRLLTTTRQNDEHKLSAKLSSKTGGEYWRTCSARTAATMSAVVLGLLEVLFSGMKLQTMPFG